MGASAVVLEAVGWGARVRGRLRGGPSSLSEAGLNDLVGSAEYEDCICSAMFAHECAEARGLEVW